MGRFAANTDTGSSATYTAGATIAQGDILTTRLNSNSGKVYPVSIGSAPFTSKVIGFAGQQTLVNTETSTASLASCVLTSGVILFAWTSNTTAVKFARYDTNGTIIGAVTTVESGATGVNKIDVCALSGGGFAVAYCTVVNGVRSAVYDNSGVVVTNPFNVEALATGLTDANIFVTPLLNGGYVVAFNNTSFFPCFCRYSATGVLQGTLTQVEASSTVATGFPQSTIAVCTLTTGEFIYAFKAGANTKFARYSEAGVLQGSITTVFTTAISSVQVAGTSDGGFILTAVQSSNIVFNKYSSTGVALTRLGTLDISIAAYPLALTPPGGNCSRLISDPLTGGAIIVRVANSAIGYLHKLDIDGRMVGVETILSSTTFGQQYYSASVCAIGTSIFTLFGNNASPYFHKLTVTDVDTTSYARAPFGQEVVLPASNMFTLIPIRNSVSMSATSPSHTHLENGDIVGAVGNSNYLYAYRMSQQGLMKRYILLESDNQNGIGMLSTSTCRLSNGNVVIAAIQGNSTRASVIFHIFTPDLVRVATVTSTLAVVTTTSVRVAALRDGGFAAIYNNTTTNVRCSIFTSSGVLVRPEFIIFNSCNANTNVSLAITATPDGGFAALAQNTTSNQMLAKFDAQGGLLYSVSDGTATTAAATVAIAALPDGSILTFNSYTNAPGYFNRLSSDGSTWQQQFMSLTINGTYHILAFDPATNTIIQGYNSPVTGKLCIIRREIASGTFRIVTAPIDTNWSTQFVSMAISPDGILSFTAGVSSLNFQTLNSSLPVLGVAKGAASAGSQVSAAISGTTTIRPDYPFPAQFNDVGRGGVKGTVFGKTATLTTTINSLG